MVFAWFASRRRGKRATLDTRVFEQVLASGDADACMRLAEQLLAFIDNDTTPEAECALVMPYVERLACCPDRDVRARVAELARDCSRLAPQVVFAIVGDEDDIALPFILHASVLDEKKQLAIFRAGDAARRLAVCQRPDVATQVLDEAIASKEREALLACLKYMEAGLSPEQARRIYARFNDDEEIVSALLRREDLPLEVRVAHVEAQTGRLREVLARDEWQSAAQAAHAAVDLEEQALVDILVGVGGAARLETALEFLARRGKLTAAVLLRAALAGHVGVLVRALAWLAGIRVQRLEAALRPGASLGVARAALARSGLPQNAHALVLGVLLAVRKVAIDDNGGLDAKVPALGPLVLEAIAETDVLGVSEKMEAASLLQRLGDENTRVLAARFVQSLLRHAA